MAANSLCAQRKNSKNEESSKRMNFANEFENALKAHQSNDLTQAEALYKEILLKEPNHSLSLHQLGLIKHQTGESADAVKLIKNAIAIDSANPVYHFNLGIILKELGAFDEAIVCLETTIALKPDYVEAYYNLGALFQLRSDIERAEISYKKTIELSPSHVSALNNLGIIFGYRGMIAEAKECYEKAIVTNPEMTRAYYNLVHLYKVSRGDELIESLEKIKEKDNLPIESITEIHFALGKIYADLEDFDKSFENFLIGNQNRGKHKGKNFDIENFHKEIDSLLSVCDINFFKQKNGYGINSEIPIFIVGMPRSGTTLIEQILSSHPEIFGANELTYIKEFMSEIFVNNDSSSFENMLASFQSDDSRIYAEKYLKLLKRFSGTALRITDKMPGNYEHLWLIALMFPKAKVIHCIRNPVDTCLSCFCLNFEQGYGFTNDLSILGQYYNEYQRIMRHWHNVLTIDILDVTYESIVDNQEVESKRIIEFCGLDWSDNCLDFHNNKRSITTASMLQVRKKIYRSSIGRWRRYEKHLKPLLDALENDSQ